MFFSYISKKKKISVFLSIFFFGVWASHDVKSKIKNIIERNEESGIEEFGKLMTNHKKQLWSCVHLVKKIKALFNFACVTI